MHKKGKLELQAADLNQQIYDEQNEQLELRQQITDQKFLLDDMQLDVKSMTENIEDVQSRKFKL